VVYNVLGYEISQEQSRSGNIRKRIVYLFEQRVQKEESIGTDIKR